MELEGFSLLELEGRVIEPQMTVRVVVVWSVAQALGAPARLYELFSVWLRLWGVVVEPSLRCRWAHQTLFPEGGILMVVPSFFIINLELVLRE